MEKLNFSIVLEVLFGQTAMNAKQQKESLKRIYQNQLVILERDITRGHIFLKYVFAPMNSAYN